MVESYAVWCVLKVPFLFYALYHYDTIFHFASLALGTHPGLISVVARSVQLNHKPWEHVTLKLNSYVHGILYHLQGFAWPGDTQNFSKVVSKLSCETLGKLMDENKQPADVS